MLKISLDIDDVLAGFLEMYSLRFDTMHHPSRLHTYAITRNVTSILKHDKEFWLNLPVKNTIDFIPELYCTKRVNPKTYTRQWLINNGFPNRPIYQVYYQGGNKADKIKGRVDVHIDDSYRNVKNCLDANVPALWYKEVKSFDDPEFVIYDLNYNIIYEKFRRIFSSRT